VEDPCCEAEGFEWEGEEGTEEDRPPFLELEVARNSIEERCRDEMRDDVGSE